jgi:cyclin D6
MLILLQENLLQCYNAMQEIAMDGYRSQFDMVSSSDTPVNVLDQHFSSSESEKTNGTIETISTNSSNKIWAEKDIKRRKISAF